MYIKDGIAYAGEPEKPIRISVVRPLDNYKLWVRFNTGEAKIFDLKDLLDFPAFSPLKDKNIFNSVYIDYGTTVWNNGEIDIDPLLLYEKGSPADSSANA